VVLEEEVQPAHVRRAAMDLLARREHGSKELITKLGKRFPKELDLIETEVSKLTGEGLQSDFRLAEALVRSRVNRGQGPVKIKYELRQKGVSDEVSSLALESVDVDWFELVAAVADKKFGSSPPADAKERAKRSRFLQQRGFEFEQISAIF